MGLIPQSFGRQRSSGKKQQEPTVYTVILKKTWWERLRPLLMLVAILVFLAFSASLQTVSTGSVSESYYNEQFLPIDAYEAWEADATLGFLDLQGVILSDAMAGQGGMIYTDGIITPSSVQTQISSILNTGDVSGIVIRMNSPGGMLTASDEIAHMIRDVASRMDVYLYSSDLLASGGYYIAVEANEIYAHKQAVIGSIGVVYQLPNVQELARDKLGIAMEVYTSGRHKDMESMFRDRTPEEKRIIQDLLDSGYRDFIHAVDQGRESLSTSQVRELATGRVWNGGQAKANQLIDDTLYASQVIPRIKQELGIAGSVALLQFSDPPSFLDEVFMTAQRLGGTPIASVLSTFERPPGLYYLYSQ